MDAKDAVLDLFRAYDCGTDLGRGVVDTDYEDLASEIIDVLYPDGYVLVPVIPTVEMMQTVQAYQCDHSSFRDWRQTEWLDVLGTWNAMLAARPEVKP